MKAGFNYRNAAEKAFRLFAACMISTSLLAGCSANAAHQPAETENTKETETAEVKAPEDLINEIADLIAEGSYAKAVTEANTVRISAKTDHSLDEETIASFDNLYALTKLCQYLETEDTEAAAPWVEKIDYEKLPESVKGVYDSLMKDYGKQLGK